MKTANQHGTPEEQPPLTERLRDVKSFWRRTFGDYFLTALGYFASALIFVVALVLGLQKAEPSEREYRACTDRFTERVQTPPYFPDDQCTRLRKP